MYILFKSFYKRTFKYRLVNIIAALVSVHRNRHFTMDVTRGVFGHLSPPTIFKTFPNSFSNKIKQFF